MQGVRDIFSAPFNWCDRRCERCPLAAECPVYRRELQQRWRHEARGRDPDAAEAVLEDAGEILEYTMRLLLEIATAEGIDLDAPLPPRPIVLDAKRIERASMALVRRVAEAARVQDSPAAETTAELTRLTNTLAMKVARIACYLDVDSPEELWVHDAAPNLLLVERLKAEIGKQLARIFGAAIDERIASALAELDRVLDPLIRQIGEPARAVLAALEARGAAPSPFIRDAVTSSTAMGERLP
jgi:hypothetical protein